MKSILGILLILAMLSGCNHSTAPAPTREIVTTIPGFSFAKISPGTFQMGSSRVDREKADDELPRHTVRISYGFCMGKTEVTVGQYRKFALETGHELPEEIKNAADSFPATGISWQDTQDFISWLNQKDPRHQYRLPSEAEWEYACRAGSSGPRFFSDGTSRLDQYAWYWNNSEKHSHPVGKLRPNLWGLYDMYGNVYEWVNDWYNETYYQESPETDPKGPESGNAKVYRGGGWSCNPDYCRSSFRNYGPPDKKSASVGFRLVMETK